MFEILVPNYQVEKAEALVGKFPKDSFTLRGDPKLLHQIESSRVIAVPEINSPTGNQKKHTVCIYVEEKMLDILGNEIWVPVEEELQVGRAFSVLFEMMVDAAN